MKLFVLLSATMFTAYGWVDWMNIHVGPSLLPSSESDAVKAGWKVTLKDNNLKISWYIKGNDPSLMVAFDSRKNVAGLKVNQLKSKVSTTFSGVYTKSGLYDETTIGGKTYFTSTVLFTPPGVLRAGGRRKLTTDEVVMGVFVKKDGSYVQIDREGCQHEDTGAVEQGCQPQYGLVFSDFDSSSSCDSLSPFYTIWDPLDTGNLIGFGWLTSGKTIPNSQTVTEYSLKVLFPNSPSCLEAAAQKDLSSVEVWLSKDASAKSTCDSGSDSWTSLHCDRNMRSMHTIL